MPRQSDWQRRLPRGSQNSGAVDDEMDIKIHVLVAAHVLILQEMAGGDGYFEAKAWSIRSALRRATTQADRGAMDSSFTRLWSATFRNTPIWCLVATGKKNGSNARKRRLMCKAVRMVIHNSCRSGPPSRAENDMVAGMRRLSFVHVGTGLPRLADPARQFHETGDMQVVGFYIEEAGLG